MKKEKEMVVRLLPKGLIHLALGGYITEGAAENTESVVAKLSEFMERHNFAIISKDGKLDFVSVEYSPKRKKILGIF